VAPGDFGSTFLSKSRQRFLLDPPFAYCSAVLLTIEHDEKKDASRSPRFTLASKREP